LKGNLPFAVEIGVRNPNPLVSSSVAMSDPAELCFLAFLNLENLRKIATANTTAMTIRTEVANDSIRVKPRFVCALTDERAIALVCVVTDGRITGLGCVT
jgi:hypothetical protein